MVLRILIGVAAAVLAALALWHPAPSPPAPPAAQPDRIGERPRAARSSPAALDPAVVYVAGAVRRPGLYHVASGSRAADAVALAGGLTGAADAGAIDLAERVTDGEEIYAPAIGSAAPRRGVATPRARRGGKRRTASPPPLSVDVNTASPQELAAVPGIGRALAARIVAMRESAGAFSSLDELLDVAGMTQARLERASPFLQPL
ncbi:MAG: ComEA family DNA-binding protein [Candidatus Eremiobacteraeota bacterium]|nr:ComEA family DNA-binding protein [Candidatus Eremiobacteraeota bacterium]